MAKAHTRDEFKEALHQAKLKITPVRIAVLHVLKAAGQPLRPEMVAQSLPKKFDKVTIYRTLKSLKKAGILQQDDLGHNHMHYEYIRKRDHHHYIVCTQCGKINKFRSIATERRIDTIVKSSPDFTSAVSHSFEIFALCKNCAKIA